jgi:GMP synthase (glutamine-hydrolysing)
MQLINGNYSIDEFISLSIKNIKEQVGSEKVILGLSGGVDSSVVAALVSEAVGKQLICIFVDHGLMRKNEGDEIEKAFSSREMQFIRVNAQDRFLNALKGVTDPEQKRKIIGAEFIRVFEEQAKACGGAKFLAQGTIYPDIVESGDGKNGVVKSHHNVGGLPKDMGFEGLVEPLKYLFKEEVRAVGAALGLPEALVRRQPFPGPGLGVRVIGEVTKEKLDMLREADYIFRTEVDKLKNRPTQYFAILTGIQSVGVTDAARTYSQTVALRAVMTKDFMTCIPAKLPYSLLVRVAKKITQKVKGVNRVVFDVSPKPPATIEWE